MLPVASVPAGFVTLPRPVWLGEPLTHTFAFDAPASLGDYIVDGVLFPVLALALAFAARTALVGTLRPAVFKVAIPILLSLVLIRLSVRVLSRTFPAVRWVRTVERSISWLAWIAVVLWVTGVSPLVLDAMDEVHWKVGATERVAIAAEGSAPIVVIGTTNDPATPYVWAENLADQLQNGLLVTYEGEGHTAYNKSNDCINDAVDDFFISDTPPADQTVC